MTLTAAEKQKRYREKKSNAKVTVTQDGNVLAGIDATLEHNRQSEAALRDCGRKAMLTHGLPNCTCRHCQNVKANGSRHTLNHGPHKDANTLAQGELNRVALPGDTDYKGVG